ncbi:ABC transporter substrate-binding protein, partial [Natrarchaeobius sp. A-rgal3]|uniref:ABC transporter substrate-binding protein n=1 Tax=Natrarchaeobius versutus TaxID=1679078 RepID=UPI00350EA1B9
MSRYDSVVSRRNMLAVAGMAGATALAGCIDGDASNGDGNGGDDGSVPDPDDEVVDHADTYFLTANSISQISDFQYNPNQWAGYTHISFGLFAEWAQYIFDQDEYHPHAVEDWELEPGQMTLHLSDEFTWGNGDDITADDFIMQLELGDPLEDKLYDFVDEFEAVDDHTIELYFDEDTNQDLVRHVVLDRSLDHPPADWGEVHEAYLDGEDVQGDIFGHDVQEPTPSGPVELTETDEQRARFDIRDDHHLADNYNWNGYQMEYRTGNEAYHQSFAAGELDGVHSLFAGPGALQQFPDTLEQIQIPGGFGLGIVFNHDDDHFGERSVRQAFCYAVDTESAIAAAGADTKMEFPVQAGLTVPSTSDWVNPGEYKSYDQDHQRVEALLQDAGYERNDDDLWERDGSTIDTSIVVPAGWSDWVTPVSTMVDQLSQAGFDAELASEDQGVWEQALSSGDFSVAAYNHIGGGDAAVNHPYYSFSWKFENDEHGRPNFFNYPEDEVITIPDGNGGEISVNPREELSTIANTNDD